MARRKAEYLDTIPERYCNKCEEWWPEDETFFYRKTNGSFGTPCRACVQEQKQQNSAIKPCCIPGCDNPRHRSSGGRYTSYCTAHLYHRRKREAVVQVAQS